ncbi:hypothetical protein CMU71_05795 [Elizabethkingia anophelis]|nr:hypothetical protein [Elizabethkingia anophelis]MDV3970885.1 hypothetical protein [Elizabethkingia anophelis]OPC41294.1 hypothetical protein BAY02_05575 [Elizabethkingia anophelis]
MINKEGSSLRNRPLQGNRKAAELASDWLPKFLIFSISVIILPINWTISHYKSLCIFLNNQIYFGLLEFYISKYYKYFIYIFIKNRLNTAYLHLFK